MVAGALLLGGAESARAAEGAPKPPSQKWSFAGPFGTFDRGATAARPARSTRKSARPATASRTSRSAISPSAGGPGFSVAQAQAFASEYKVKDGPNDQGEMFERPGRPADYFPSPFPNEQAARVANGGASPPDLSLITKARSYGRGFPQFLFDFFTQYQEQGPNYVAALLQGYEDNAAGRLHAAGGLLLQQVLPRPRHQDAEAAERRSGHL